VKKKLISILVACAMALSCAGLLAGCGNRKGNFTSLSVFADTLSGYSDAFKSGGAQAMSFAPNQNWIDALDGFNFLMKKEESQVEPMFAGGEYFPDDSINKAIYSVDKNLAHIFGSTVYKDGNLKNGTYIWEWYRVYTGATQRTNYFRAIDEAGAVKEDWKHYEMNNAHNEIVFWADFIRGALTADYRISAQKDKDVYTARKPSDIIIDPEQAGDADAVIEVKSSVIEISEDDKGKDSLTLTITYTIDGGSGASAYRYYNQLKMRIVLGGQSVAIPEEALNSPEQPVVKP